MQQSRRDFLASAPLAAAAGVLGARISIADEGPETTTIRLRVEDAPPAVVSGVAENSRPCTSRTTYSAWKASPTSAMSS